MRRPSISLMNVFVPAIVVGVMAGSLSGCKLPDAGPRPMVMPAHPVPNLPAAIPGKHYSNSQPRKSPLKSLLKPITHRGN